jgi:hypothetical protein
VKTLLRAALVAAFLLTIGAASASAAPLSRVNYISFTGHVAGFMPKLASDLSDMADASDLYDIDGIISSTHHARNLTATELRWLSGHTPTKACFRALYDRYVSMITYEHLAMTNLYSYWNNWPYSSQSTFNRGLAQLKTATAKADQVTTLLGRTHC